MFTKLVESASRDIGAANTVLFEGGEAKAYNTDFHVRPRIG
jgi:shikimate 5-dehydrogenase